MTVCRVCDIQIDMHISHERSCPEAVVSCNIMYIFAQQMRKHVLVVGNQWWSVIYTNFEMRCTVAAIPYRMSVTKIAKVFLPCLLQVVPW